MRKLSVLRCFIAVALTLAGAALAQSWPVKPVRYIVPFPPAGSPDIVARLIAERFTRLWGQQVVVDNRSGAGGAMGAAFAAKQAADGYTLFQCNIASSAIAEALYAKPGYDHQRDFAPISLIGKTANVLVSHPSLPVRTPKELIAYARAHPAKLSYGTSPPGTSQHLVMESLKLNLGVKIEHIAYKGAQAALTEVISGHIPLSVQSAPGVLPTIQSGRVRALAVTTLKRLPQLPGVPTMDETVFPGLDSSSWYGLCAPAATPVAILDKVHTDLTSVLRAPEMQTRFREMVLEYTPTTREEYGQFIRLEAARWAKVIKDAGVVPQ